jgi:hypothetical protein
MAGTHISPAINGPSMSGLLITIPSKSAESTTTMAK